MIKDNFDLTTNCGKLPKDTQETKNLIEKILQEVSKETGLKFTNDWKEQDKKLISLIIEKATISAKQEEQNRILQIIGVFSSMRLYRSKSCQLLTKQIKSKIEELK